MHFSWGGSCTKICRFGGMLTRASVQFEACMCLMGGKLGGRTLDFQAKCSSASMFSQLIFCAHPTHWLTDALMCGTRWTACWGWCRCSCKTF